MTDQPDLAIEHRMAVDIDKAIAAVQAELPVALGKLGVLGEISERARRDERGTLPDDTLHSGDTALAEWEHRIVEEAIASGCLTWRHVLMDATFAAYAQREWPQLRDSLLTVAAACLNWVMDGDKRTQAGDAS